jgi:hypothetical protein
MARRVSPAERANVKAILRAYEAEQRAHPEKRKGDIARRLLGQPQRAPASAAATMRVLKQTVARGTTSARRRPSLGSSIVARPENKGGAYAVIALDRDKNPIVVSARLTREQSRFDLYKPEGRKALQEALEKRAIDERRRIRCGEVDVGSLKITSIRKVEAFHRPDAIVHLDI